MTVRQFMEQHLKPRIPDVVAYTGWLLSESDPLQEVLDLGTKN